MASNDIRCAGWGNPPGCRPLPLRVRRAGRFVGPVRLAGMAGLLLASLSACTIVRVRSPDGVRTSYYPGMAVIRITPTDSVQVVEVESLGPTAVGNSATLGWIHSRVAIMPPGRCQLILWRPRTSDLDELRALLGPRTEICDGEGEGR
jgi:hypothetical protein